MIDSKLAIKLMKAGISPKYRAFEYLLYLLPTMEPVQIMRMTNMEIAEVVTKKFGVSADSVDKNFKSLISGSAYVNQKKSELISILGNLDKNQLPSTKEFLIVVQCVLNEMNNS